MMIILSENLDSECFLIDIVIKVVLCVFLILLFGKGSKKREMIDLLVSHFPFYFYLNVSVSCRISVKDDFLLYRILYTASSIGISTLYFSFTSLIHLVP